MEIGKYNSFIRNRILISRLIDSIKQTQDFLTFTNKPSGQGRHIRFRTKRDLQSLEIAHRNLSMETERCLEHFDIFQRAAIDESEDIMISSLNEVVGKLSMIFFCAENIIIKLDNINVSCELSLLITNNGDRLLASIDQLIKMKNEEKEISGVETIEEEDTGQKEEDLNMNLNISNPVEGNGLKIARISNQMRVRSKASFIFLLKTFAFHLSMLPSQVHNLFSQI